MIGAMKRIFYCGALILLLISGIRQSVYCQTANSDSQVFKTGLAWETKALIGDAIALAPSKHGQRRVIPILGGTFKGPKIEGTVLPMGEDWQLVRPDGDTELQARYILKTNDGYLIHVINRALLHVTGSAGKGGRYIRSVLDIEAPLNSPYDYLNHAVFLGTLTVPQLKPGEKPYVIIGVYQLQ